MSRDDTTSFQQLRRIIVNRVKIRRLSREKKSEIYSSGCDIDSGFRLMTVAILSLTSSSSSSIFFHSQGESQIWDDIHDDDMISQILLRALFNSNQSCLIRLV